MYLSIEGYVALYNEEKDYHFHILYYEVFKEFLDIAGPVLSKVKRLTIQNVNSFILDGEVFPNVNHLVLHSQKDLLIVKAPFRQLDFVSINPGQIRNVSELGPINDLMVIIHKLDIDVEDYMQFIMNSLVGFRGRLLLEIPNSYVDKIKAVPTDTYIADRNGRLLPIGNDIPLISSNRIKSARF